MSLIKCSKCKNQITDSFYTCVYCGHNRKETGVYSENLPRLQSSMTWAGNCRLLVTTSGWNIEYSFREYQRHNRTEIFIAGARVEEYIQALKDCFIKYEEWSQIPLEELDNIDVLKEYFERNAKEYPIRINRFSITYSDDAHITSIFGKTNLEIRIDDYFHGVCLGGYHEVSIAQKDDLDELISTIKQAQKRAMIVMPFLKLL